MRASIITVMLLASSYGYAQAVTYGAIAYSRSDGVIGKSSRSGDQPNAERSAIHGCRENGGIVNVKSSHGRAMVARVWVSERMIRLLTQYLPQI